MIYYNWRKCGNLHLYLKGAFQHGSLLKPPLPFHQQNKQKRESTCFRIEAIDAVSVLFSLYEKCWIARMRLQIIYHSQSNNLHFTYTCIYFFKLFAYLLLKKINV